MTMTMTMTMTTTMTMTMITMAIMMLIIKLKTLSLLRVVHKTGVGCNMGDRFFNILAYTDDTALLAPSSAALQQPVDVLHAESVGINMMINITKTINCVVFNFKIKHKIVSLVFRNLSLCNKELNFAAKFKYLGHLISLVTCD